LVNPLLTGLIIAARNLSQTYAIESQAFVMHTTAVISKKGIDRMRTEGGVVMNTPGGGSSAIFGPDGRKLTEDIPETEEGIIYADLKMSDILHSKGFLDVCGHYSRPDLLWLGVDSRDKKPCRIE
jgi:predicted amidohydrolase